MSTITNVNTANILSFFSYFRIKTNGSLPRDKRQCISPNLIATSPNYTTKSPHQSADNHVFRFETEHILKQQNNAYENVTPTTTTHGYYYENVDLKSPSDSYGGTTDSRTNICGSPYENIHLSPHNQQNNVHFQQSPRTRIKTTVGSSKER